MRISNILPFVLSAGAILLPPQVKDSARIVNTLPISAQAQDISIQCVGGCPVMLASNVKNGVPTRWTNLYPGKMHADISVKDNTVVFNGEQIWPATIQKPLRIVQTTEGTTYEPFSDYIPVSTSLDYKKEEILTDSTTMMKIHRVEIEVLAIADAVVHAETLIVRVAETEHGLALLPTIINGYKPSPYTDSCTTVWCRVKGTIVQKFNELRVAASQKIKGWRGCGGQKHAHKVNGLPLKGGPAKFGPGSSLHPNGHHNPHQTLGHHRHHRHQEGGLRRFMVGIWHTIVVPVFYGALIGLVFGAALSMLVGGVRRLRNRSQTEYIIVEQVEAEEGLAGPPKYDEIYREPQTETEDEKKELLQ